MQTVRIERTTCPKEKPGKDNPLVFGIIFTDHMLGVDYEEGKGWLDPRVVPYYMPEPDPSTMVFHYGQEMFEGLKAYKAKDGRVLLFRLDKNIERTNRSNDRLCIPRILEDLFMETIKVVAKVGEDWIPTKKGTSLYIRPFVIATDPYLRVWPSNRYKFMIILPPVGAYYESDINLVKIWIEDEYARVVKSGIGEAKTGGNYVASMASQVKAREERYSQVLWLDGAHRKHIEEVGTMNILLKINDTVVTLKLNGSILPGVTGDSVIALCKEWGIPVEERQISVDETVTAAGSGETEECFGTGTAVMVSPVGELRHEEEKMEIGGGKIGEMTQRIYDTITGIQLGRIEGPADWSVEMKQENNLTFR